MPALQDAVRVKGDSLGKEAGSQKAPSKWRSPFSTPPPAIPHTPGFSLASGAMRSSFPCLYSATFL